MKEGVGSAEHAAEYSADADTCEACAVAHVGTACGAGPWVDGATVTVEADVVVISGPRIAGQVIVPRQHIGSLEELPLPGRAQVLAAIRRAVGVVGTREPPSPARVVESTDSPASPSHVCFHVLPQDGTAS